MLSFSEERTLMAGVVLGDCLKKVDFELFPGQQAGCAGGSERTGYTQ